MQKILGIGNSLVDLLIQLSSEDALQELHLPKGSMQLIDLKGRILINDKINALLPTQAAGGSAANTIKALASMKLQPGFIGKVADDSFGTFFRDALESVGVCTQLITEPCGSSGTAYTFICPDGERTFATYLGVAAEMKVEDISPKALDGYDILYVEGYLVQNHELMERVMGLAHEKGMTICLDLASYNIVEADQDFFKSIISQYVNIVLANEEEAQAFTSLQGESAAREIGKLCDIAVVKLGSQGSCAFCQGETFTARAEKVEQVIDTTGAGDYFAAGFLYGLVNHWPMPQRLQLGSFLAAEVIQVVGTTLPAAVWEKLILRASQIETTK